MNTGLKRLYWRLRDLGIHPHRLLSGLDTLPQNPRPSWQLSLLHYSLKNELRHEAPSEPAGTLTSSLHPHALETWRTFLPLNPNNLGLWASRDGILTGARLAEQLVVKNLITLLGGSRETWTGYVTSGATEGNLYSLWLLRNRYRIAIKNPPLLLNDLTHYSLSKAADILSLPTIHVPITPAYTFDRKSIETAVNRRRLTTAILPITAGYTQTGTTDSLEAVVDLKKRLHTSHRTNLIIHCDAALNGLILPFTDPKWQPLSYPLASLTLDFHKSGHVPFACGVVLFRRSLLKSIEKPVPYLAETDATLLGSRSGIPALAALTVLQSLGHTGFARQIRTNQAKKAAFVKKISQLVPDCEVIDDPRGLSLGIVTKTPLPETILRYYGLFTKVNVYHFPTRTKKLYIYKASFL